MEASQAAARSTIQGIVPAGMLALLALAYGGLPWLGLEAIEVLADAADGLIGATAWLFPGFVLCVLAHGAWNFRRARNGALQAVAGPLAALVLGAGLLAACITVSSRAGGILDAHRGLEAYCTAIAADQPPREAAVRAGFYGRFLDGLRRASGGRSYGWSTDPAAACARTP